MKCEEIKPLLTQYLLGDLDNAVADEVKVHLEKCGSCRVSMREIEPTLDLLRDALAAPSRAPKHLTTKQRLQIADRATSRSRKVVRWFAISHPNLLKVAAVLLVCGVLAVVLLPTLNTSRRYARNTLAPACKVEIVEPRDSMTDDFRGGRVADSVEGNVVADISKNRRTEETVHGKWSERRQMAGQAGVSAGGGIIREGGKEYAAKASGAQFADAPASAVSVDPYAATPMINAPAEPVQVAQQSEANEKMVELQVKLPKPLFIGTPTSMKPIDKAEHDRWLVESGRVAAPSAGDKDQKANTDEVGLAGKGFTTGIGRTRSAKPAHEQIAATVSATTLGKPLTDVSVAEMGAVAGGSKKRADAVKNQPVVKGLYGRPVVVDDAKLGVDLRRAETEANARVNKVAEQKPAEDKLAKAEEETSGPRFKAYGVNPFVVAKDQPFSTFGIDCDTASYTLARNYMARGYLPPAEAVRTEEFVNFFDYAYKAPEHDTFKIYLECAPSKFGRGLQMMKIGVKGRRLGREEQRQAALTFLVDTSGSMEQPDRIVLVKNSLRMLVEKLNPTDLVSIVKYSSHARIVIERVPASEKQKILDAIDGIECGGSTNLEEGMDRAYQIASRNFVSKGENRVLLMSDGVANLGGMAAKEILQRVEKYRRQGIFCSVFGFGIGTYNDEMLEELANKGDGTYKFIDSADEARQVFVDDLSANLNTIAKDVKIQVEFNPNRVARYRQIGYENRQLKKEDFRNDKIDAGEVGSGQSVTALYEMELGGIRIQNTEVRSQNMVDKMIYPDREPLATVRVRYQRVDNGQIEEIERALKADDILPQFDRADARFRLAACAAQFAEILRGSPFSEGREFNDVSRVLAPIALELNLDGRVQEFKQMIDGANGLSRGQ